MPKKLNLTKLKRAKRKNNVILKKTLIYKPGTNLKLDNFFRPI